MKLKEMTIQQLQGVDFVEYKGKSLTFKEFVLEFRENSKAIGELNAKVEASGIVLVLS
jgi:hypothetical protein